MAGEPVRFALAFAHRRPRGAQRAVETSRVAECREIDLRVECNSWKGPVGELVMVQPGLVVLPSGHGSDLGTWLSAAPGHYRSSACAGGLGAPSDLICLLQTPIARKPPSGQIGGSARGRQARAGPAPRSVSGADEQCPGTASAGSYRLAREEMA